MWLLNVVEKVKLMLKLEEDGSLALSSLEALRSNATELCFSSENGKPLVEGFN